MLKQQLEIERAETHRLQKQQSQFQAQETKINYLEIRIQELTNLIKSQKEKIINAFLRLFPEKDLLQELIIIHLEYTKTKKQELPSIKLRKQRNKLQEELEEKVSEGLAEKIELILNDCEKLVEQELELEERLQGKTFLIEEQKQTLKQITYNNENERKIVEKHEKTNQEQTKEVEELKQQNLSLQIKLACVEGELKGVRSSIPISENQSSSLVTQLREKQTLTLEEINQINNFLKVKKDFLAARQETIEELQQCFNALEKKLGKHDKINEIGNVFSNVGGAITGVITFGIPKAVGEAIKSGSNLSKLKYSKRGSKEFQDTLEGEEQISLGSEEKEKLSQLKDTYSSLASILNCENQSDKLFNTKYETYDVLFKDGV